MDELKLKLSTKFMRGIVAKLMARAFYKKFGYKINIQLNDVEVSIIDGDTDIHANVEVKMNSDEFKKLLQSIGED